MDLRLLGSNKRPLIDVGVNFDIAVIGQLESIL